MTLNTLVSTAEDRNDCNATMQLIVLENLVYLAYHTHICNSIQTYPLIWITNLDLSHYVQLSLENDVFFVMTLILCLWFITKFPNFSI